MPGPRRDRPADGVKREACVIVLQTLIRSVSRIQHHAVWLSILLLAALVEGCWIPEQFDAKVTVNTDGSYTYSYDGVLTFAPALADARRGVLDARGEMEVAKLAPQLRQSGFQKADYLGKGRFSASLQRSVPRGQASYFLSKEMQIFYVLPQNDGRLVIGAFRPDANALVQLHQIGAKIDGTLSVSVGSGVTVLKHNAQSEPWLFGLLGSYKWQIKSPDANPFIVVQPAS